MPHNLLLVLVLGIDVILQAYIFIQNIRDPRAERRQHMPSAPSSAREAEEGGSLWVPGQPGPRGKTLPQKKNKSNIKTLSMAPSYFSLN